MIERLHPLAAALGTVAVCSLVVAGCAGTKQAETAERLPTAAPVEAIVVAEPPEAAAPEAAKIPPPTVGAPASTPPAPEIAGPRPPATVASPAAPAMPKAVTVPAPRAATVPPPQVAPKAAIVPPPQVAPKAAPAPLAAQPTPAPLDLASLGTRLKETRAIGVFTKLALKNQVDDLLAKFRAYHKRQGTATLPELRRSYDMLLLKVLSLLQDSDPPLARDIVQSRAAIWGILVDPRKFNEASLMAGATT